MTAATGASLYTSDTHLAPGVTVMADPDLTLQSIRNLISNAVRHSRPDTTVRCHLTPDELATDGHRSRLLCAGFWSTCLK